jgi:hypothetical protein
MVMLELPVEVGVGHLQLIRAGQVPVRSSRQRGLKASQVTTHRRMNHAVHRHRAGHDRDDTHLRLETDQTGQIPDEPAGGVWFRG